MTNPKESTSADTIGIKVEDWYCYGMPAEPLTPELRAEIIEFAQGFEECYCSKDNLVAMDEVDLVRAAYWTMAEYARGQM